MVILRGHFWFHVVVFLSIFFQIAMLDETAKQWISRTNTPENTVFTYKTKKNREFFNSRFFYANGRG